MAYPSRLYGKKIALLRELYELSLETLIHCMYNKRVLLSAYVSGSQSLLYAERFLSLVTSIVKYRFKSHLANSKNKQEHSFIRFSKIMHSNLSIQRQTQKCRGVVVENHCRAFTCSCTSFC